MDQEFEQFLSRMTEYADIPKSQLERLACMMQFQTINKNAYFIRMEDEAEKFAYITKGVFRVFCVSEEGMEKTLAFRSEGQFIAPYTPVLCNQKVWYYIQALTDSEIYYIRVEEYKQLSQAHICWEILEKNYIIELLLEKEERERSLLMDRAEVRYETFIGTYPEISKRVQQNYIASYLGITPVSLSRLKSQKKA